MHSIRGRIVQRSIVLQRHPISLLHISHKPQGYVCAAASKNQEKQGPADKLDRCRYECGNAEMYHFKKSEAKKVDDVDHNIDQTKQTEHCTVAE